MNFVPARPRGLKSAQQIKKLIPHCYCSAPWRQRSRFLFLFCAVLLVAFLAFQNRGDKVRRYHHIGIPTSQSRPGERHIDHLKTFIVGHENSEYGVEWMRFEADAPVPELVRQVAHVAFEVSDLASELAGREILIAPNSPSNGVRVAFIVENGAPIELMEFTDPNHPDRRQDRTWSSKSFPLT